MTLTAAITDSKIVTLGYKQDINNLVFNNKFDMALSQLKKYFKTVRGEEIHLLQNRESKTIRIVLDNIQNADNIQTDSEWNKFITVKNLIWHKGSNFDFKTIKKEFKTFDFYATNSSMKQNILRVLNTYLINDSIKYEYQNGYPKPW